MTQAVIHIISFSGGKDSTAMLLMMIERGMRVNRIINIDTTKEFPEMYEHIREVQEYIMPLEIEIYKIDFDYWLGDHIKTRGKNKGKRGYGFPDFRNRWCTALKRETFIAATHGKYSPCRRGTFGKNLNIIEYHGISFDEKERTGRNKGRTIEYPLVEWKITGQMALDYCYKKGFTWGGLYEKRSRVSCWCCPLSRIGELKMVYNEYPLLWEELRVMDKKSYRRFRSDYTLDELEAKFKNDTIHKGH